MLKQALEIFIRKARNKVIERTPKATGSTADSYTTEVGEDYAKLMLEEGYFGALVKGRRAWQGGVKNDFADALLKWMKAVSITTMPITEAGASQLAYWINKEGTKLNKGKAVSSLAGINFKDEVLTLKRSIANYMKADIKLKLHKAIKR